MSDGKRKRSLGSAYIPPARLRAMQGCVSDKSSEEYQRIMWEALKKRINGLINKVNTSNIDHIVRELFKENIVRGRGLLSRAIIKAQAASPIFTSVYSALVAVINSKFPQIGELIVRRVLINFKRGLKRRNKDVLLISSKFIAHFINHHIVHEVLALEILTLLLDGQTTGGSVEIAVELLNGCGATLQDVSPKAINAVFERLHNILHESKVERRVQYMIEVMFAARKHQFKGQSTVLDLIEEDDQVMHVITWDDVLLNDERTLDIFKFDENFEEVEKKYKRLKCEILDENSSDECESESDSEDEDSNEYQPDHTLRRILYLTIKSSISVDECVHKLLKLRLKPGQEVELCDIVIDSCAQHRSYDKFFGSLAQRLCMIDRRYSDLFQQRFREQYVICHRLETTQIRNIGKFYGHLLQSNSISWKIFECVKLNEDETTSSSRVFLKVMFQELCEHMGLKKLSDRLKDQTIQPYFSGMFSKGNSGYVIFAINFFTQIGLGSLTDDLREHLTTMKRKKIGYPNYV